MLIHREKKKNDHVIFRDDLTFVEWLKLLIRDKIDFLNFYLLDINKGDHFNTVLLTQQHEIKMR